jgi:pyruvate,water dikinase
MLELQMPVPAGLVITSEAFETFLESNELRRPIEQWLRTIEPDQPASGRTAAAEIQRLIAAAAMPAEFLDCLATSLPPLTSGMLAVRSSAIGEDSANNSYAGQLDSVLNVAADLEAVVAALKHCWGSYWSERAIAYQRSRGIALGGMAVVIQEQVPAALSGVLFTRHPAAAQDGSYEDWMLTEYCAGLGDALVGGRVSPGRVLLSRTTRQWRHEVLPERLAESAPAALLSDKHVWELASFGLALEEAFNGPQDIEWSVSQDGQLFLLQSRPITTSAVRSPPKESETVVVWSNANVNENFPDPISPLLYSIASLGYYHYFRNLGLALGISRQRIEAMEQPLRNLVGVHGARLYYNLTNIHAVLRMAPFGEFLADSFNEFVGAGGTAPADQRLTWKGFSPTGVGQLLEVARIGGSTLWQLLSINSRVARFERTVDRFAEQTNPAKLAGKSPANLLRHLRGFLDIRCNHWVDASLADAAAMLSYGLLKRMLEAEFPGDGHAALHNSLLKGLRDVVSSAPAVRLWELSREIRKSPQLRDLFANVRGEEMLRQPAAHEDFAPFHARLFRFIDEWGFRCSGELMLTAPSFQERPEGVVEILRAYADVAGESPAERLYRQEAERQQETRRVQEALMRRPLTWFLPWPRKSFVFSRLLGWTQRAIGWRERARLKQALLYSRCRRIVLAIGDRLVEAGVFKQPEDVFYLTVQELDALLSGQSMFPGHTAALVALRRTAHAQLSRQQPPDTFSLATGSYWSPTYGSADRKDVPLSSNGSCLHGCGVCGGVATAPAGVLESSTELHRLSAGDILVTRQTDPGWGPVFPLIQGLIMERGGMLSHGAILAREYGLPTVVGIPDATRRMTSGQVVTVNGDLGLVQLH